MALGLKCCFKRNCRNLLAPCSKETIISRSQGPSRSYLSVLFRASGAQRFVAFRMCQSHRAGCSRIWGRSTCCSFCPIWVFAVPPFCPSLPPGWRRVRPKQGRVRSARDARIPESGRNPSFPPFSSIAARRFIRPPVYVTILPRTFTC